jgi:hypothetical protein
MSMKIIDHQVLDALLPLCSNMPPEPKHDPHTPKAWNRLQSSRFEMCGGYLAIFICFLYQTIGMGVTP